MLDLLLLHNYEDVVGMIQLLPMLSYQSLRNQPINITSLTLENYNDLTGESRQELTFTATLPVSVPKAIKLHRLQCHLFIQDDTLRGSIPLYHGILRHYLPNHRDYVYLPQEDMIVLKSMAHCIPSGAKEKATPANCYVKKEGEFLLLPTTLSLTEDVYRFAISHTAKEKYILYDPNIVNSSFMEQYLNCFLNELT